MYWIGTHYNDSEVKNYILGKKHLIGAKVAVISNIMLGIKEDLVENKGDRIYESKIFLKALENSVENLATKVNNGYKIGNYIFPDAETLVAIVRNKLAHGNYIIDFDYGRVIINHQGTDIILSLYKLSIFIVSAFAAMIKDEKTTKYERDMVYFERKDVATRERGVKDITEIKQIIRGYNYLYFAIESLDGTPVGKDCILLLESLLKYVKFHLQDYKKSSFYKEVCEYLSKRNCRLICDYRKLTNNKDINDIINLIGDEMLHLPSFDFQHQVESIGYEVHRKFNPKFNSFNPLGANIKHLLLLNAIDKKNSVDVSILGMFMSDILDNHDAHFYYDEYGMVLISMFNSLFMYPMDDIYTIPGEYTLDRSDGLDFSLLDLSMVNPTVINIDTSPLENAKARLDSLTSKRDEVDAKIKQQQINLSKVQGRPDVESRIKTAINDLNNSLTILLSECVVAEATYNAIKDDFDTNDDYFRNKVIIEGIRNSIAHGHYEFISDGEFNNTIIVFNDIYEGKLTFQLKIKFSDFEALINNNSTEIAKFIGKKIGISQSNSLSRK